MWGALSLGHSLLGSQSLGTWLLRDLGLDGPGFKFEGGEGS